MKKIFILVFFFISLVYINAQENQNIYNVRNYGAKGDGKTNDQSAIQKAIDACKENGGTVVLEKGVFLTGQLTLVNNLTLKIDTTATLLGIQSDDEKDYPHHLIDTKYPNRMLQDCQRRLIYGNKVHHATITGGGTINGQGDFEPWMNVKEIGTEKNRPSILAFVGCNTIKVSNITFVKPACWTQVYIESDNIIIQKIKVNTGQLTPNRDGIDIVDCHKVLIEDSHIESEDDGICFKSGSEYGCKDIIVRRCILDKLNVKAGNCFKLGTDGLGSFMNFDVSELVLKNAYQNSAFCIESMDGAVIDNLNFRDCQISNCGQAIFIMLADRKRTVPERKTRIGTISNIHFKNITGTNFTQNYPSIITGIKGHNIQNITFDNLIFELKGGISTTNQTVMEYNGKYPEGSYFGNTNAFGFFIRHADSVTFTNCKITSKLSDKRPWLIHEDTQKIDIR